MCLAIAPSSQSSNGLFARSWRHIAATPLKLLSFGAIIHLLIGAGIMIHSSHTGSQININPLMTGFTYGVVPLFVFGFLLTWLPRKYSLSPVHYGRYNIVYLFSMAALILLELASMFNDHWALAGILLLIPGWIITLQSLHDMHSWIKSNVQIFSRLLLILLLLNLAILLIRILEQNTTILVFDGTLLISMSIIWPLVLVLAALLVVKAPAKNRIISV